MTQATETRDLGASREEGPLLDPSLQARLRSLEFVLRRSLPSSLRGDRRSPQRKGISLEFADFRGYVPGDDIRHLDWATFARLDQLIVKLYHDEEDLQLHLLVDDSCSMHVGTPQKARFARRVAAALAWIGLAHSQRVSMTVLSDPMRSVPLCGGCGSLPRFVDLLEQHPVPGKTPLHESCRQFYSQYRPRGAVVLLSDLLDAPGVIELLRVLDRPSTEVTLVQILAPDELDPEMDGDLRLLDSESGHKVEVHLTPRVIEAYRERVRRFIFDCVETARRRGAGFAFATSADDVSEFLLRTLVSQGVLR